jgi:hypothetical protein
MLVRTHNLERLKDVHICDSITKTRLYDRICASVTLMGDYDESYSIP